MACTTLPTSATRFAACLFLIFSLVTVTLAIAVPVQQNEQRPGFPHQNRVLVARLPAPEPEQHNVDVVLNNQKDPTNFFTELANFLSQYNPLDFLKSLIDFKGFAPIASQTSTGSTSSAAGAVAALTSLGLTTTTVLPVTPIEAALPASLSVSGVPSGRVSVAAISSSPAIGASVPTSALLSVRLSSAVPALPSVQSSLTVAEIPSAVASLGALSGLSVKVSQLVSTPSDPLSGVLAAASVLPSVEAPVSAPSVQSIGTLVATISGPSFAVPVSVSSVPSIGLSEAASALPTVDSSVSVPNVPSIGPSTELPAMPSFDNDIIAVSSPLVNKPLPSVTSLIVVPSAAPPSVLASNEPEATELDTAPISLPSSAPYLLANRTRVADVVATVSPTLGVPEPSTSSGPEINLPIISILPWVPDVQEGFTSITSITVEPTELPIPPASDSGADIFSILPVVGPGQNLTDNVTEPTFSFVPDVPTNVVTVPVDANDATELPIFEVPPPFTPAPIATGDWTGWNDTLATPAPVGTRPLILTDPLLPTGEPTAGSLPEAIDEPIDEPIGEPIHVPVDVPVDDPEPAETSMMMAPEPTATVFGVANAGNETINGPTAAGTGAAIVTDIPIEDPFLPLPSDEPEVTDPIIILDDITDSVEPTPFAVASSLPTNDTFHAQTLIGTTPVAPTSISVVNPEPFVEDPSLIDGISSDVDVLTGFPTPSAVAVNGSFPTDVTAPLPTLVITATTIVTSIIFPSGEPDVSLPSEVLSEESLPAEEPLASLTDIPSLPVPSSFLPNGTLPAEVPVLSSLLVTARPSLSGVPGLPGVDPTDPEVSPFEDNMEDEPEITEKFVFPEVLASSTKGYFLWNGTYVTAIGVRPVPHLPAATAPPALEIGDVHSAISVGPTATGNVPTQSIRQITVAVVPSPIFDEPSAPEESLSLPSAVSTLPPLLNTSISTLLIQPSPVEVTSSLSVLALPGPSSSPSALGVVASFPPSTLQALGRICADPRTHTITLPLISRFYGPNGYPALASYPGCTTANPDQAERAPGLLNCTALGAEVQKCQSAGHKVLLSVVADGPDAVQGNLQYGRAPDRNLLPLSVPGPTPGTNNVNHGPVESSWPLTNWSAIRAGRDIPNLFDGLRGPTGLAQTLFSLFSEGHDERADLRPLGPDTPSNAAPNGIAWFAKPLGEEVVVDGFDIRVPSEWRGTYQGQQFGVFTDRLRNLTAEAWASGGAQVGGDEDLGADGSGIVVFGYS